MKKCLQLFIAAGISQIHAVDLFRWRKALRFAPLIFQFLKVLKGHGPDGAGKDHHQHIGEGLSGEGGIAAGEQIEEGAGEFLDAEAQGKSQHKPHRPIPEATVDLIADEPLIQFKHDIKAQHGAQHFIGIFLAAEQLCPIGIGREGEKFHKEHLCQGPDQKNGEDHPHHIGLLCRLMDQGIESEDHHQGKDKGNTYIQGGMHAQPHPREGDQHAKGDGGIPQPAFFGDTGDGAEDAHAALGMPAGEGIAAGGFPRTFHDGEFRIFHPRAVDAKKHLQQLVDLGAQEADGEDIIPFGLINAPKEQHRHTHKDHFVPKMGDHLHQEIHDRVAKIFQ